MAQHGGMPDEDAATYVKQLATDGRYVRDVYWRRCSARAGPR
jgi:sulfite reductase alpha subunit-like flavoprotein